MLDYIAVGKLAPHKISAIVAGLVQACKEVECSLIGGETAEMPGIYKGQDYDLAGFIVGIVEKGNIIRGEKVKEGDLLVGLPSSGLHTNGYSLVRKVFNIERDAISLKMFYPELGKTLGEALLTPHRCYFHDVIPFIKNVKGISHITGGGFAGNIPRILPDGLSAEINRTSWQIPPLFELIQQRGSVKEVEMYQVFNMGIGMVIICDQNTANTMMSSLPEAVLMGKIIKSNGSERVIIK
jgi:phosphoribosylformylglycinamidine cyclo-ligase